ncbi:MAG: hypothetical protein V4537_14315 [Pseudomonadota bacterium]
MMVMVSNQRHMEFGRMATLYPGKIGHLYSPGEQRGPWDWMPYALDNGAYAAWDAGREWDEGAWLELLLWAQKSGQAPLWCAVPDVIGEREPTLERWARYHHEVDRRGFRAAFVAQDGMTPADVPTADCMVFLGGTTDWKDAAIRPWAAALPGRVHVGRVNGLGRLIPCHRAGVVSVDGSGWFHGENSKAGGQRAALWKYLRETARGTE